MNKNSKLETLIATLVITCNLLLFAPIYGYCQVTFADLLTVDARGGTVIRIPGFDLTKTGAKWAGWYIDVMKFVPNVSGTYGCYKATSSANLQESPGIALKPNRTYIISALIKTNFADRSASEVNMCINEWNAAKTAILYQRPNGVPAHTTQTADGWMRFEVQYTTSGMADAQLFAFVLNLYGAVGTNNNALFEIADVALVELPVAPLTPYASGEGVKFRGGPGKIPIKVESVTSTSDSIIVLTTAAKYIFDKINSTITACQRIDMDRPLARWTSSVSLANLNLLSKDDTVAILTNANITFGIQCDGLLMMSPQTDVDLTLQSLVAGKWNRLRDGYLMFQDDFGGMTVHPAIPAGTGRVPRFTAIDALDFSAFKSTGMGADIWGQHSDDRLSAQASGWRVKWTISPGERLGFSVSPVRPFDWDASFNQHYELFGSWNNSADALNASPANRYTLWEDTQRAYGLSYGTIYARDNDTVKSHVTLLHNKGAQVLNYMSAHFYYSRDPEIFINNAVQWKDSFNIDGIYSDGLPMEWLVAYEEMRMLRQLFPDGSLMIHATGTWGNGGPPLCASDICSPFIDAYADCNLTAEATTPATTAQPSWTYARFMGTKFRQGNSPVGCMKGGYWGLDQLDIAKICLVYGGRAWIDQLSPDQYKNDYLPLLNQLRDSWLQNGNHPYFYDRYYLPEAQSITGYKLGRAGMPVENIKGHIPGTITVSLKTYTSGGVIRYTTDGSDPTSSSSEYSLPLNFTTDTALKAATFADGLDESRVFSIDISSATVEDNQAPTIPENLQASFITDKSFVLSWNPSTDNYEVTGYYVYLNESLFDSTALTSIKLDNLNPDSRYSVKVNARDANGNTSGFSDTIGVKTLSESLRLSAKEFFNYPAGDLEGNGLNADGWRGPWTKSSGTIHVVQGHMTRDTVGNYITTVLNSDPHYFRELDTIWQDQGHSYWVSFTLKKDPSGKLSYGGLSLYNGSLELLFIGCAWLVKDSISVGMGSQWRSIAALTARENWVVVKLVMSGDANNDKAFMWLNPDSADLLDTLSSGAHTLWNGSNGFNKIRIANGAEYSISLDRIELSSDPPGIPAILTSSKNIESDNFKIFPNPAKDFINLQNAGGADISIYSLQGRLLKQIKCMHSQDIINVSSLENGMYLVKIEKPDGTIMRQLEILK